MKKYKILLCLFFIIIFCKENQAQDRKKIAITLDDLPTRVYQSDSSIYFSYKLISEITKEKIPIAIFINEISLYESDSIEQRKLLKTWINNIFITSGNHSFSHLNYSDTTFETISKDILKGEYFTKMYLQEINKTPVYFRFPFNSLGKDSIANVKMQSFLSSHNYKVAPFTIESSDYIFAALYTKYLEQNNYEKANKIGKEYIDFTIKLIDYFERLSDTIYQKPISQIYLAHGNRLNTDYFSVLIDSLKERNYEFISLEKALEDKVYSQKKYYYGKWGFSWSYRWIEDKNERRRLLKQEPEIPSWIYHEYEKL